MSYHTQIISREQLEVVFRLTAWDAGAQRQAGVKGARWG